jgi:hypothetical protein
MSSTEAKHSVSFGNDVEEATPVASAKPQSRTTNPLSASLSKSAKAWDLDGDGELDETELALKTMDKSHIGTLTKDQMYDLMTDNLKTQRELFKVKKVVIGLVIFTFILALSNLGTSFAAAFLAKDTKSEEGKLTDASSGKTLATDSTTTEFVANNELGEELSRQRRLACITNGDGEECVVDSLTAFDQKTGANIVKSCEAGSSVTIVKYFNGGANHAQFPICPIVSPKQATYTGTPKTTSLEINHIYGADAPIAIQKSGTGYEATGLKSGFGSGCDSDSDCGVNLVCEVNAKTELQVCKGLQFHSCTLAETDGCAENHACSQSGNMMYVAEQGSCICQNDAACPAGLVCRNNCVLPDMAIQCVDQSQLNQECKDTGNGDVCGESMCEKYQIAEEISVGMEAPVAEAAP